MAKTTDFLLTEKIPSEEKVMFCGYRAEIHQNIKLLNGLYSSKVCRDKADVS